MRSHGLEHKAVEIVGQTMATDLPSTFEEKSCIKVIQPLIPLVTISVTVMSVFVS